MKNLIWKMANPVFRPVVIAHRQRTEFSICHFPFEIFHLTQGAVPRRGRLFHNQRRRRARQFRLPLGDQLPKLQDQIAALVIQIMTL